MKRIADIPLPTGLTDVQKAEYIAFQDAMTEIENEWQQLSEGKNPDQERCIQLVNEIRDKRYAQAEERLKIRLEVINHQVEKETARITSSTDTDVFIKFVIFIKLSFFRILSLFLIISQYFY